MQSSDFIILILSISLIVSFYIIVKNYIFIKNIKKSSQSTTIIENKSYLDHEKVTENLLENLSQEIQSSINSIFELSNHILIKYNKELSHNNFENISIIKEQSKNISNIMNTILDYAGSLKNEIELNIEKIDLKSTIDQFINFKFPQKKRAQLQVINEVPENIILNVDKKRINQILDNIINDFNSFISTHSINIIVSQIQNYDRMIRIDIFDKSREKSEILEENIYNNYEKIKEVSNKFDSKRVGLALSKKLVELHGGRLWTDVDLPYKKNICFTLPLYNSSTNIKSLLKTQFNSVTEIKEIPYTILAVDDEEVNLMILKNHLSLENFHIISVTSGFEVLYLLDNEIIPDIVIIDIAMPEISGYDLTKKIREKYSKAEIPILLISANSWSLENSETFECGANEFILKPYNKLELKCRVNNLIMLRRSILENKKHIMLEHELSIARKLQLNLLPGSKPINSKIKFNALYIPMTYLAGDFYDFYEDKNGIGVLLADVTGHGIPAAIVASMLKAIFRILHRDISNPSKVMKIFNEVLVGNDNQLITSVFIYIDIENKILYSANAGHPPILLLSKDGKVREIKSRGRLIGFSNEQEWETTKVELEGNERIILYTDGMTEMKNFYGDQIGDTNFIEFLRTNLSLDPEKMLEETKRMILDYTFQVDQEDDLTMVIIDLYL